MFGNNPEKYKFLFRKKLRGGSSQGMFAIFWCRKCCLPVCCAKI